MPSQFNFVIGTFWVNWNSIFNSLHIFYIRIKYFLILNSLAYSNMHEESDEYTQHKNLELIKDWEAESGTDRQVETR